MTAEEKYISETPLAHRKKYAQYFTPEVLADFMCGWLLQNPDLKSVLEPAYGLGVFSRSLLRKTDARVTAYEIDPHIYAQSQSVTKHGSISVHLQDYLLSDWDARYDGIVCNPPYLKFHNYDNTRYIQETNTHLHTHLSGQTNIYALFLLKSIHQLKTGGRCAYVVPSEFLNSDYGTEVKRVLLQSGMLRHVIVIDFEECVFADALTTASIILCANDGEHHKVRFSLVRNISQLQEVEHNFKEASQSEISPEVKWRRYYTDCHAAEFSHLVPFSNFAKVVRGIATGANSFFGFRHSKAQQYAINEDCLLPCICKSTDVQTAIFTGKDFERLVKADKTVFLFNASADIENSNVSEYLRFGQEENIDKRHLTSRRTPWYAIEKRKPAPIWVSVFNRKGLRFVRNEANIHNLTTFHCVYPQSSDSTCGIDTNILFAYLTTDAAKDILLDNAREYGNGLVKFEPNDINKGLMANLALLTEKEAAHVLLLYNALKAKSQDEHHIIGRLDSFFREKYAANSNG